MLAACSVVIGGASVTSLWAVLRNCASPRRDVRATDWCGDMPVVSSILNSLTAGRGADGLRAHNQMLVVAEFSSDIRYASHAPHEQRNDRSVGNFSSGRSVLLRRRVQLPPTLLSARSGRLQQRTLRLHSLMREACNRGPVRLAVAEAQHTVRELATDLEKRGVDVSMHSSRRRPDAWTHERSPRRSERSLRPAA